MDEVDSRMTPSPDRKQKRYAFNTTGAGQEQSIPLMRTLTVCPGPDSCALRL